MGFPVWEEEWETVLPAVLVSFLAGQYGRMSR